MRNSARLGLVLCAAVLCGQATAVRAQIPVDFGGHSHELQDLVDHRYGKHRIKVLNDYIGARGGDTDPWCWTNGQVGALTIRLLRVGSHQDAVGWYLENGSQPILPEGGGMLFGERCRAGQEAAVWFKRGGASMGFYVDAEKKKGRRADDDDDAPEAGNRERFYTNRLLNDAGPGGAGATHPPFDGDVQALVFDVSHLTGKPTWLVCFEDRDSGGRPTRTYRDAADEDDPEDEPEEMEHGRRTADNDYFDVVFEVTTDTYTPVHPITFGALKLRYR